MVLALAILCAASILGSGILFIHQRLTTFMATAAVLAQGQWLLLTLLDRTILKNLESLLIFTVGSVILAILWGIFWRQWRFPQWHAWEDLWRDGVVILVTLITISSAWLISSNNGWQAGSGQTWVMHGFYNGDAVTFGALVQKSFDESELVVQNPFAGNGELEYPALLHAGVAEFVTSLLIEEEAKGAGWLALWPTLVYLVIAMTVPLFFLLWDIMLPAPTEDWKEWLGSHSRLWALTIQALIVLIVLALSWESYVYPQGHLFLMALFMLVVASLSLAATRSDKKQWLPVVVAHGAALVLVFANAVTGTAAVAVLLIFMAVQTLSRKQVVKYRSIYLVDVPIWIGIFLLASPGNGSIGGFGVSYTAALDMLRLVGPLLLVSLGLLWYLSRFTFTAAAAAGLMALAVVTYFFSSRDIVVANASRFFYHALLVGYPLMAYPLIRAWFWLRRELLYTTHTVAERVAGWGITLTMLILLVLPAVASVASTHDNLLFKNGQVISAEEVGALQFIAEHVPPEAVVLASPSEPWTVPLFTGRAILRADFWLSPNDTLLQRVQDAFAGNAEAQVDVVQQADLLFLRGDERNHWDTHQYIILFGNEYASLWQLGS